MHYFPPFPRLERYFTWFLTILLLASCSRAPVEKPVFLDLPASLQRVDSRAGSPDVTATIDILDAACLVGNWQVADLTSSMAESGERTGSPLRVSAVNGAIRYHFAADGQMQLTFDKLEVRMEGVVEGEPVSAVNRLQGSASASYQIDALEQEITLSRFGGDGIHFQVEINEQLLTEGDFPAWRALSSAVNGGSTSHAGDTTTPTRVIEQSRAAVQCAGDQMTIQALDPLPGPQVGLRRVED
jgi:hypothetical protein